MKILLLLMVLLSAKVSATFITFDLRDPLIEALDGAASFDYVKDEVTATVNANVGVLNRTNSGFGIDVPADSCDNSDALDQACDGLPPELISVSFNQRVRLVSSSLSGLTAGDLALWHFANLPGQIITSSGIVIAPFNSLIEAGDSVSWSSFADNFTRTQKGFSLDSFTIEKIRPLSVNAPASMSVILLIVAMITLSQYQRGRQLTRILQKNTQ
jgi:hypothetical protein